MNKTASSVAIVAGLLVLGLSVEPCRGQSEAVAKSANWEVKRRSFEFAEIVKQQDAKHPGGASFVRRIDFTVALRGSMPTNLIALVLDCTPLSKVDLDVKVKALAAEAGGETLKLHGLGIADTNTFHREPIVVSNIYPGAMAFGRSYQQGQSSIVILLFELSETQVKTFSSTSPTLKLKGFLDLEPFTVTLQRTK
jgi:hypothetical protein